MYPRIWCKNPKNKHCRDPGRLKFFAFGDLTLRRTTPEAPPELSALSRRLKWPNASNTSKIYSSKWDFLKYATSPPLQLDTTTPTTTTALKYFNVELFVSHSGRTNNNGADIYTKSVPPPIMKRLRSGQTGYSDGPLPDIDMTITPKSGNEPPTTDSTCNRNTWVRLRGCKVT